MGAGRQPLALLQPRSSWTIALPTAPNTASTGTVKDKLSVVREPLAPNAVVTEVGAAARLALVFNAYGASGSCRFAPVRIVAMLRQARYRRSRTLKAAQARR